MIKKSQHAMNNAPIGILDSGIGGLSVWQEIHRKIPHESITYLADHAYQPYGERTVREIQRRVKLLIKFLLKKNVKLIVVACNTATVAGIDTYRTWFPEIPIIGVVPVVKTAASITKTHHIAIISTEFTAESSYQKRLIKTFAVGCKVENIGVPDLASFIEKGEVDTRVNRLLRGFLQTKKMDGVDVIALGCTHYPFVRNNIEEIAGKGVSIIDSGGAVARHVLRVLTAARLRSNGRQTNDVWYTTSNRPRQVSKVAHLLTKRNMVFRYVSI